MALAERIPVGRTGPGRKADVVLGDDWVAPDASADKELQASRARRGLFSLNRSPLTRKIITFNLIALNVLVAGILYLNSSRDSLAVQQRDTLSAKAELIADVFEAQLPRGAPVSLAAGDGLDVAETISGLDLRRGLQVYVFDTTDTLLAEGRADPLEAEARGGTPTVITDGLSNVWNMMARMVGRGPVDDEF